MFKFIVLCVLLLLLSTAKAELLEICPNPYNSKAEYVKVVCNSSCILSDGEGNITINRSGVFYIAKNKTEFMKELGFYPDYEFKGQFALANDGDEVYLYENGTLVDYFAYGNKGFRFVDKGLIYFEENGKWDFRYEDWSNFVPVKDCVEGVIIVTPANFHFKADTVVSYTFVTDDLVSGNYTLYLEAKPVGGIPLNEYEILKKHRTVFLHSNSYRYFHWKFGLNNDTVLITTENWKWDKRGYIIVLKSEKISNYLRKVLEHDLKYTTNSTGKFNKLKKIVHARPCGKSFEFNGCVEVFVLPDHGILDFMKAERRLYIEVPYMHFDWFDEPILLDTIKDVAKKAEVKIILNDDKKNYETVEFLKKLAESENLNLEVKTIPNLHGKLVISDDKALITSANFDKYGLKLNREIGIIFHDKKAVEFLANSFMDDWKGDNDDTYLLPAIVLLTIAVVATYLYLRRLRL
jgi:hypothetical protein